MLSAALDTVSYPAHRTMQAHAGCTGSTHTTAPLDGSSIENCVCAAPSRRGRHSGSQALHRERGTCAGQLRTPRSGVHKHSRQGDEPHTRGITSLVDILLQQVSGCCISAYTRQSAAYVSCIRPVIRWPSSSRQAKRTATNRRKRTARPRRRMRRKPWRRRRRSSRRFAHPSAWRLLVLTPTPTAVS
jgi:hypothetical protein